MAYQDDIWSWEEAFDKFGFNDGDGHVHTSEVMAELEAAGCSCEALPWSIHNVTIVSIEKDGQGLIPQEGIRYGYDNPRNYLPSEIVRLLDRAFPQNSKLFPYFTGGTE